jgi:hypothetical protein
MPKRLWRMLTVAGPLRWRQQRRWMHGAINSMPILLISNIPIHLHFQKKRLWWPLPTTLDSTFLGKMRRDGPEGGRSAHGTYTQPAGWHVCLPTCLSICLLVSVFWVCVVHHILHLRTSNAIRKSPFWASNSCCHGVLGTVLCAMPRKNTWGNFTSIVTTSRVMHYGSCCNNLAGVVL